MSFENLKVESDGGVCRITISREKALNALNRATLLELERAVDALADDTRVLVLTGAGDKSFIAGADIAEMAELGPDGALAFSELGHRVLEKLDALEIPVIAEVNGFALGGGCELMLACDFAVASENAKLGQPEVGLGVTPGFGGTTRLSRLVGPAWARRLVLTAERLSAQQALAIGLVTEVVAAGELRARVDGLAASIVKGGPVAVRYAKRSLRVGAETDLASANRLEQQIFALCFASEDQSEGMRAFVEKRKPVWSGR